MIILTIMVVSSTMNDRSDCYVKLVKTNYHDDYKGFYPKIHLIFLSKRDYNKINKMEKMIEKYYELEVNNKKETILYNYLKEIIKHLKECEVMEVFSDHIDAFHLKFHYISKFLEKPEPFSFCYEGEDRKECFFKDSNGENVRERMNEKISKVIKLLLDKIRFQ